MAAKPKGDSAGMIPKPFIASCGGCGCSFRYDLFHMGFADSTYAYCESCGLAGIMSGWQDGIPEEANFKIHGPITLETEPLLAPCSCGGRFSRTAAPRCPSCHLVLDPIALSNQIEANSDGAKVGWRWQKSWQGIYMFVVNDRSTKLIWSKSQGAPSAT